MAPSAAITTAPLSDDEERTIRRQALALHPDPVEGGNRLGFLHRREGRLEEAARCFQWVLTQVPHSPSALNNLASLRVEQGRIDDGLMLYEQAVAADPDNYIALSNRAFTSCYHPALSGAEVLMRHRAWNDRYAEPLKRLWAPHLVEVAPERLRIGYVSSDFRAHPVASFLEPVLECHDGKRFEIFCYATDAREDTVTARLKAAAEHWIDAARMQPEELAARVRADGIHILIDLGGHTAPRNLLCFAVKPAPVQAAWAGYCFSTGLDAIDWLIIDATQVPEGHERLCSEAIAEVPGPDNVCYRPPDQAPEVAPLPADRNGHLTFGSLANLSKVNRATVRRWARVLDALPSARFIFKSGALTDPPTRAWVAAMFEDAGIGPERLDLLGQSRQREHLETLARIDICLDTWPYTGGATTLEALWMGVPVVTLTGETYYSRHSAAHLHTLGLDELIADDEQAFAVAALALAGDRKRLRELRSTLRRRMATSPLCDGPGFTRDLEAVYRRLWENYLERVEA